MIDVHAHLDDEKLLPRIDEIVDGMKDCGLECIVNSGFDDATNGSTVELTEKYERIFGTLGIHPHEVGELKEQDLLYIERESKREKILAVGEIGLDYYYDLSDRETQKREFVRQLELAYSLKLPVLIHLRDAYGDMCELLRQNSSKLYYGGVLHCYSGSAELVREFNKYGFFYSFGGAVTFKNATEKPAVVRAVGTERLLLETDCPYMTPVPYRGQPNEPKYVRLAAQKIAEILNLTIDEVDKITTENAKKAFPKLNEYMKKRGALWQ